MTPNDKKRRGLFLTIGLFILPFQLVINHFYGGDYGEIFYRDTVWLADQYRHVVSGLSFSM